MQSNNKNIKPQANVTSPLGPPDPIRAGAEGLLPSRAMILAAGLGTRLKPWTDTHPKALAIVNSKSLLQHNIEYLQQAGIYNVIVNVHHFAEQIIEAIEQNNGWGSTVTISDETSAVLETGGGLKKAAWYFKDEDSFILMNVDVLTDMPLNKMIVAHSERKPLATLATTNRKTSRYFLFDEQGILCGWRNVKTSEQKIARKSETLVEKAFSGIHVISQRLLAMMPAEEKFSMVDVYLSLAKEHNIMCYDHSNTKFIDVGKPESIKEAELLFTT